MLLPKHCWIILMWFTHHLQHFHLSDFAFWHLQAGINASHNLLQLPLTLYSVILIMSSALSQDYAFVKSEILYAFNTYSNVLQPHLGGKNDWTTLQTHATHLGDLTVSRLFIPLIHFFYIWYSLYSLAYFTSKIPSSQTPSFMTLFLRSGVSWSSLTLLLQTEEMPLIFPAVMELLRL